VSENLTIWQSDPPPTGVRRVQVAIYGELRLRAWHGSGTNVDFIDLEIGKERELHGDRDAWEALYALIGEALSKLPERPVPPAPSPPGGDDEVPF
jgi:hypothetical protein